MLKMCDKTEVVDKNKFLHILDIKKYIKHVIFFNWMKFYV